MCIHNQLRLSSVPPSSSPLQNSSPRIQPTATYPRPSIQRKRNPMKPHKTRTAKRRMGVGWYENPPLRTLSIPSASFFGERGVPVCSGEKQILGALFPSTSTSIPTRWSELWKYMLHSPYGTGYWRSSDYGSSVKLHSAFTHSSSRDAVFMDTGYLMLVFTGWHCNPSY